MFPCSRISLMGGIQVISKEISCLSGGRPRGTWRSPSSPAHPQRCYSTPSTVASEPTIFALSSAAGRAAVAVIRLSGSRSDEALQRLAPSLKDRQLPQPRLLSLASLHDPDSGQLLDRALVARFIAPYSFTGEDCVELHVHGGPAVVRGVLDALSMLPGLRPALAGEFTRRAFECGKLDLTEVEGLADLLSAQTTAQHRQALALASGTVRGQYEAWRAELLRSLAAVEAVIDFGEDEQIAEDVAAAVRPCCATLRADLMRRVSAVRRGQAVREGVRVALIGVPNAGKSSLLNALAGRDAAIVSPWPGTTRDVLETELELGGARVILSDSAGIRETQDPVEAEGVRRARAALRSAHIVIHVTDVTSYDDQRLSTSLGGQQDAEQDACDDGGERDSFMPTDDCPAPVVLRVYNKVDLLKPSLGQATSRIARSSDLQQQQRAAITDPTPCLPGRDNNHLLPIYISCTTGQGLDTLVQSLETAVQHVLSSQGDPESAALVTRERHATALRECILALERYDTCWDELELAAEELRVAMRALGSVTGEVGTEEVLGSIFREFCIGK